MSFDSASLDADAGPEPRDSRTIRDLHQVLGRPCTGCGGRCSAFEIVWSIALGLKESARCFKCLVNGLEREPDELKQQLHEFVQRRECYRLAWKEAERLESEGAPTTAAVPVTTEPEGVLTELEWDAGDTSCGELLQMLRTRLKGLQPGTVFRVRATDPSAPEDIPAWCRLAGHNLVSADHPIYLIRRKGD